MRANRPERFGFSSASGEAARYQHAEVRHPIDHGATHLGLRLLSRQTPGAQAPANQRFVAKHRGLNQGSAPIAGGPLPAKAPSPGDGLEVMVGFCHVWMAPEPQELF
jgi:hypothetical protein